MMENKIHGDKSFAPIFSASIHIFYEYILALTIPAGPLVIDRSVYRQKNHHWWGVKKVKKLIIMIRTYGNRQDHYKF